MPLVERVANLNLFLRNFDNLLLSALSIFLLLRFRRGGMVYAAGLLVTTAGLLLWWAAKLTLGRNYSLAPRLQGFVTRGIYSKMRHPIYVGSSLMYVGWVAVTRSFVFAALAVAMIALQAVRTLSEERLLSTKLGTAYAEYKRRTWF